ncbi:hypothetical protein HNR12_005655 [Streptomonospora nanhaiensis]|uniref:Uncharacterized protein n=1 Tax=Streptomonospora nanhaiensis TaxID=1323731 RepID=A0A853BXT5_9ACTN|nr:hypothetical protein [Streptomonospora nanhaiensis]NYI99301.1 hypothetical protein [Streptomonospora nanhaiensis]
MSSAYPIIWAMKHAPCTDVYEQSVLIQMADAADEDGCNAYLSKETIAKRIAGDISPETVRRKWRSLERRGLIRPDTSPPPPRYLKIPANRRTKRWELCIPYSWWSDAQREQVQRSREDRGLEPLTPESRPDLSEAPLRAPRADKGLERPHRRKKSSPPESPDRGHSQCPQGEDPGATHSAPQGPLTVPPRGHSQWPNPPGDSPEVPSSPPAPPATDGTGGHTGPGGPAGREDDGSANDHNAQDAREALLERAQGLVDDAVRRWGSGHRAPGARDRQRLSERVADELVAGGEETVILEELTRDLGSARSAVRVVLGARTATPGWGRPVDPRPDPDRYVPQGPLPVWCGLCDERTRLVTAMVAGSERLWRCARCHPQAVDPAAAGDGIEPGSTDPALLEQMLASLAGAGQAPRPSGGGLSPAAKDAKDAAEAVRRKKRAGSPA